MALHLITGCAGQEHITSADQGAYNMATYFGGEFVFERGNKFALTVLSNNSISIADGEAMMQGRYIKLPIGTTETLTVENGSQGMKRKDIVVIRYIKDSGTGIESAELAVVKGTPAASNPVDPTLVTGVITDGEDLVNEMPLYRINIDGLNIDIDAIDTLFIVKRQYGGVMADLLLEQFDNCDANGLSTNHTYANFEPDLETIKSKYSFLLHTVHGALARGFSNSRVDPQTDTNHRKNAIVFSNLIPTELLEDGKAFSFYEDYSANGITTVNTNTRIFITNGNYTSEFRFQTYQSSPSLYLSQVAQSLQTSSYYLPVWNRLYGII